MRSSFYAGIGQLSILTVLIIGLSACSSNASSATPSPTPAPTPAPTPVPSPTPTPTPVPSAHLYVATRLSTGFQIQQFTLPITSTSTPSVTISNFFGPVAVDSSGNLFATDGFGNIAIFTAPLSNSSVPSVTFPAMAIQMGFDAQGNLYVSGIVGGNTEVDIFKPPFSSGTTPAQTIPIPATFEAVDLMGNLYLETSGVQCTIEVLAPPYNGMPATIFSETCNGEFSFSFMAATNTQLFVAFDNFPNLPGAVDVFDLSSNGSNGFAIQLANQPGEQPEQMVVDSNGNLYVVESDPLSPTSPPVILVYAAPLSSSSSPAVTLVLNNLQGISGLAIGP